jgi:phosphoribosylanthranilate isomerase
MRVTEEDIETPNVRTEASAVFVEQGMPEDEIRSILEACDPRIVQRHLELHRDRLLERLVDERKAVERVEEALLSRMRCSSGRGC